LVFRVRPSAWTYVYVFLQQQLGDGYGDLVMAVGVDGDRGSIALAGLTGGEGGGRLHTDGGGAQEDGQRREEAVYVQSDEAELLAKAMRSEIAMLGLDSSTRLAAAEAPAKDLG
jgi:hypothetical protein